MIKDTIIRLSKLLESFPTLYSIYFIDKKGEKQYMGAEIYSTNGKLEVITAGKSLGTFNSSQEAVRAIQQFFAKKFHGKVIQIQRNKK